MPLRRWGPTFIWGMSVDRLFWFVLRHELLRAPGKTGPREDVSGKGDGAVESGQPRRAALAVPTSDCLSVNVFVAPCCFTDHSQQNPPVGSSWAQNVAISTPACDKLSIAQNWRGRLSVWMASSWRARQRAEFLLYFGVSRWRSRRQHLDRGRRGRIFSNARPCICISPLRSHMDRTTAGRSSAVAVVGL
jgi:hypothetical protein